MWVRYVQTYIALIPPPTEKSFTKYKKVPAPLRMVRRDEPVLYFISITDVALINAVA